MTIFDKLDGDKNGILDETEIGDFYNLVEEKAGNNILSKREAKRVLKAEGLKELDKNELLNFIKTHSEISKEANIVSAKKSEDGKSVVIQYEDGSVETYDNDTHNSTLVKEDENSRTTENYDENHLLTKRTVETDTDGQKTTEVTDFTTTEANETLPVKKVITNPTSTTTINYDEAGKEATSEVIKGTNKTYYEYDENGENPRVTGKVVDKGQGMTEETTYTYNDQGDVNTELAVTFDGDGKANKSVLTENKGTEDEVTTTTELVSFGMNTRITKATKDSTTIVVYKNDDDGKKTDDMVGYTITHKNGGIETYSRGSKDQKIYTKKDADGNEFYEVQTPDDKLIQRRIKPANGKELVTEYDGNGNTYITIQFDENLDRIAETFGCSKDDITALNNNKKFTPGAKILVPGEHMPNDERIAGRATCQEMIDAAQRQENENRMNYYKSLGIKDFSQYGKKVKLADEIQNTHGRWVTKSDGSKEFKAATDEETRQGTMKVNGEVVPVEWYSKTTHKGDYTVIGKVGDADYYMVKDNTSNNLYYADSTLSRLVDGERVRNIRYFNQHAKNSDAAHVRSSAYDGYDTNNIKYAKDINYVKTGQKDKYDNEIIITKNGYSGILKNGVAYYNYDDKVAYAIETEEISPKDLTTKAAEHNLGNAKSDFDNGLDAQGWMGDFVDWIGEKGWNSKNSETHLRQELNTYQNQINELKNCKTVPEFKQKFKKIFKIDYDANKIADYYLNPSDTTFKAAFGTKNNIATRVQEYFHSQDLGVGVLKGVIIIGSTILTLPAGGGGGAAVAATTRMALAAGTTSMALNTSDRLTSNNGLRWEDVPDIAFEGVLDAGMVYGGSKLGTAFTGLSKTLIPGSGVVSSIGRGTLTTALDAGVVIAPTAMTANENTTWVDYASNGALYMLGRGLGAAKGRKAKTTAPKESKLDRATVNGEKMPGGKFSPKNFETVKTETLAEMPTATPKRAGEIYREGEQLRGQHRAQGREIQHIVEDGKGFLKIGKETIDLSTAPKEKLQLVRHEVEQWNPLTPRNKQEILAKIDEQIVLRDVNPTPKPTETSEVVAEINSGTNRTADSILSSKQGPIGPHDASILSEHLVNNLNTPQELEAFIGQVRTKVGVNERGEMFVCEVQGKDYAADLVRQAQRKINTIKASQTGYNDAMAKLDNTISAGKGLSENDFHSIKAFAENPNATAEQLSTLLGRMRQIPKKSSALKKLISNTQTRLDGMQAE